MACACPATCQYLRTALEMLPMEQRTLVLEHMVDYALAVVPETTPNEMLHDVEEELLGESSTVQCTR